MEYTIQVFNYNTIVNALGEALCVKEIKNKDRM